jgi:hypothetical protein
VFPLHTTLQILALAAATVHGERAGIGARANDLATNGALIGASGSREHTVLCRAAHQPSAPRRKRPHAEDDPIVDEPQFLEDSDDDPRVSGIPIFGPSSGRMSNGPRSCVARSLFIEPAPLLSSLCRYRC